MTLALSGRSRFTVHMFPQTNVVTAPVAGAEAISASTPLYTPTIRERNERTYLRESIV